MAHIGDVIDRRIERKGMASGVGTLSRQYRTAGFCRRFFIGTIFTTGNGYMSYAAQANDA